MLAICLVAPTIAAPVNNMDVINKVNAAGTTWQAHVSPRFIDKEMDHVKKLCGTFKDSWKAPKKADVHPEALLKPMADIPASFDARTNWPECSNVIGHVRDQVSLLPTNF